MKTGVIAGAGAYLWWGLGPIYFKQLQAVPPEEILCHRIVWSVLLLVVLVAVQHAWSDVVTVLRSPAMLGAMVATGILVATNWGVFIYAIATGRVLEASLGYFTNPIVSMALGFLFLKERVRPIQGLAIALALSALVYLAVAGGATTGRVPWIPFTLAASFGLYGLVRKTVPVGATVGTLVETSILFPFAAALLAVRTTEVTGDPAHTSLLGHPLLLLAGVITTVPLLLFTTAARRLRLMTMGFLQYICPTCQFLLAVLVYHEPFQPVHAVTFGLIWAALALYTAESARAYRQGSAAPVHSEAEVEVVS